MDGLISVWDYEGIVRRAILSLKYKYATEVGRELTGYLTDWLLNNKKLFTGVSLLVPIPIHWHRENVRGFNQCEEIGKSISVAMNWKYTPDLLIKKQSTVSQVELGGEERSQNLKGAFAINPKYKLNKTSSVLLFDDVFTTGSTLKEATKILKMAGIEKVWGLTIAR